MKRILVMMMMMMMMTMLGPAKDPLLGRAKTDLLFKDFYLKSSRDFKDI